MIYYEVKTMPRARTVRIDASIYAWAADTAEECGVTLRQFVEAAVINVPLEKCPACAHNSLPEARRKHRCPPPDHDCPGDHRKNQFAQAERP